MFNGVLSGLSRSGTEFFYTNPLHRRTHRTFEPDGHGRRAPWQACACCPPNLMRLLSSWNQYLATGDGTGVQIHQYASADIRAGEVEVAVRTGYPWDGRVTVEVVATPSEPWTLSLRVPGWSRAATLSVADASPLPVTPGYAQRTRVWRGGDRVTLDLDLPVRRTDPDPRVDAIRGCVAFERGPIVYCVESADLLASVDVDDLRWDPGRDAAPEPRPDLGDGVVGVGVPVEAAGVAPAIPYYSWANRGVGGMRVWLPR